jgi:hypothetical protein
VVLSATINAPAVMISLLTHALDDLRAVGRIEVLTLAVADELAVTDFELAPTEPAPAPAESAGSAASDSGN